MQILLVHGLGRTPFSLFGLAAVLRKEGHRTRFFGYSATLESLPSIVRRLTQRLISLARSNQPVGLIGHSLGGVLLRLALHNAPELRVHRLILLATPNRPPCMARSAWRWLPFRLFTRSCGSFLATSDGYKQLPELTVPHTVIAGTAGPCTRYSPLGLELNDGVVAVSETLTGPECEPVLLPVLHTWIMDAPAVRKRVVDLLGGG